MNLHKEDDSDHEINYFSRYTETVIKNKIIANRLR